MVGGTGKNAINKLGEARIQVFIRESKAGNARKTKLSDGGGMYLTLTSAGTPVWRLKYRIEGQERSYTIGTFAAYPLTEARKEREAAKALIRQGRDPVKDRQLERAAASVSCAQTFESLAGEWLAKQQKGWSAVHYDKSKRALERDVFPRLGRLPVNAIKPVMVAHVIEAIVKRGTRDTAAKVLQHVASIFGFGQARGLLESNPARRSSMVGPLARIARRSAVRGPFGNARQLSLPE
jgi:integrase-like protein/Arm domain-containing DNA-binding protein